MVLSTHSPCCALRELGVDGAPALADDIVTEVQEAVAKELWQRSRDIAQDRGRGSLIRKHFFPPQRRNFLIRAINLGFVRDGCLVLWDNATIHTDRHMVPLIRAALQQVGAKYVILPKHAPELNPCEYVFAEVKCFLRQNARPNWTWQQRLVEAFQTISHENMVAYYKALHSGHCRELS